MVVLAQSPSGQCAQSSSQAKIATVMLEPINGQFGCGVGQLDAALLPSLALAGTSEGSFGVETQAGRWRSSISLRDWRYPKPTMLGINVRFSGTSSRVGDLAITLASTFGP
jgi:hypothetical protein